MTAVTDMLKADFAGTTTRYWVLNRLYVLLGFLATTVVLVAVYFPDDLDVGSAALCLTNVMLLTMSIGPSLDQATGAQEQFINMARLHEYTEIVQEAPDVLEDDRKYQSFTVTVQRSALRGCESWQDELGQRQVVRLAQYDNGFCAPCRMCVGRAAPDSDKDEEHFVLLRAAPNGRGLVADEGETLAALDPNHSELKGLDWHHIVAVNSAVKDVSRLIEELCYGHSDTVQLTIQSGLMIDGAKIEIENLVAGYADIPTDVIKGINLTIERKTKVAIAGTTGCGKSTMLLCLLRILEPRSGSIKIEGVDTQHIGLKALRRSIGLVPQDPVVSQALFVQMWTHSMSILTSVFGQPFEQ